MKQARMELEEFTLPAITVDDERRIGRLAIDARLKREAVMVWMVEQPPVPSGRKPRQEEAPMWRECITAWNAFKDSLNDLLGMEEW
jgi:hypothetical protein